MDGDNAATAADGLLVARHALGAASGAALTAGLADAASAPGIAAAIQCGRDAMALDVDADGDVDGADSILISRYLLGLRGAALTDEVGGADANAVSGAIRALLP
ncbi:MAG: hypothetical protein MPK31_00010 [Gammaproteobacteria bacterium]|nr:hypothetical protein [Gammaproteobacteria bacterium]MDA8002512.1 hypothetical protein [Alphaproteobacteria bacterium]